MTDGPDKLSSLLELWNKATRELARINRVIASREGFSPKGETNISKEYDFLYNYKKELEKVVSQAYRDYLDYPKGIIVNLKSDDSFAPIPEKIKEDIKDSYTYFYYRGHVSSFKSLEDKLCNNPFAGICVSDCTQEAIDQHNARVIEQINRKKEAKPNTLERTFYGYQAPISSLMPTVHEGQASQALGRANKKVSKCRNSLL